MNYHHSMTDEKLIRFYLNGDPNAMSTLVKLYKDRVYRSIYIMVQEKPAAEEIFQETFICLINNMVAGKSGDEGNFLEWATRIAQELCMEYIRKNNLAALIHSTMEESVSFSLPAALPPSGYHGSHDKIRSMINLLPDNQRQVMLLNHYGGLSFKEIAGVMKCSLNTALDSMKLGLNNLGRMMVDKEIVLN